MDITSILISLLSAVLAGYAIYQSRKVSLRVHDESLAFQRQQAEWQKSTLQQERVFRLFELWTSSSMMASRARGWSWLFDLQQDGHEKAFLGQYRRSQSEADRQQYYSVSDVTHFFGDLNTMIDQDMVDLHLLRELFGNGIKHWLDALENTDMRCSEDDTSEESVHARNWWISHVYPLRDKVSD